MNLQGRNDLSWYKEMNDRDIEVGATYQWRRELSLYTGISNPRAEEGATLVQRKERSLRGGNEKTTRSQVKGRPWTTKTGRNDHGSMEEGATGQGGRRYPAGDG
jgi:hypothetical protein